MPMPDKLHRDLLATILLLSVAAVGAAGCKPHAGAAANVAPQDDEPSRTAEPARSQPDLSGRTRFGKASFYAKMFTGRKMADGKRMNPHRDNAASRTLPLGTTARVTNI
ncbi:MAG TPA: hypothetical protein VMV25_04990, partial [Steroidobacteraceae bacterium]|nr:hypothetical protein [Steroidobacteraceae bacterium]